MLKGIFRMFKPSKKAREVMKHSTQRVEAANERRRDCQEKHDQACDECKMAAVALKKATL